MIFFGIPRPPSLLLKLGSKLLFPNRLEYICTVKFSKLETKFNMKDVVQALKTIVAPGAGENLIDSKAVTNIMVFRDEIDLNIRLSNPSLQARKKLEVTILEVIHQKVHPKAKIKINTKVAVSYTHLRAHETDS